MDAILKTLLLFFLLNVVHGHFRLTYPQTRLPEEDFLDNQRTTAPCGVAQIAGGPRTTLEAGSSLNVTWHLAYPHQGGIQVQLLKDNKNVVEYWLTDQGEWTETQDATAQYKVVKLPNGFTCDDCTIRVWRQALEWTESYKFYSCADVKIVNNAEFSAFEASAEACSRHGTYANGKCTCERLYSGDICQYADDCATASDCEDHGQCIDTEGTSFPRYQCFCSSRYFGRWCQNENPADFTSAISTDLYQKQDFSDEYRLYYRQLPATKELEVVLSVKGQNWVGLGWRPQGMSKACQAFPSITGAFVAPTSPPSREPTLFPADDADERPAPAGGIVKGRNPGADYVPMDCTDIVIGRARGLYSKVTDHYTRDRSTPLFDELLGGIDSLTAATAYESVGMTVIKFRRKIKAYEQTDFTIENALMDVIWAKGQTPGAYIHQPHSGIEKGNGDKDFYRLDEVKYHGQRTQRGISAINFLANDSSVEVVDKGPDICSYGSYAAPSGCKTGCDYRVDWEYNKVTGDINFNVSAKQDQGKWTGIGFAPKPAMENMDLILASTNGGVVKLGDYSIGSRYASPTEDANAQFKNSAASYADGSYKLSFSRSRAETFKSDCFHFIYPIGGGPVTGGSIGKHTSSPAISPDPICVEKCGAPGNEVVKKESLKTRASFKLTGDYDSALGNVTSSKYVALKAKLLPELTQYFTEYVGDFESVDIVKFSAGSIKVELEVSALVNKEKVDDALLKTSINVALERALEDGAVGGETAEPGSIVVGVDTTGSSVDKDDEGLLKTEEIVIIAIACLLVAVACVVMVAKCAETRSDKKAKSDAVKMVEDGVKDKKGGQPGFDGPTYTDS